MSKTKTLNHFYGSGMAAFTRVKYGFRVVYLFFPKIIAKMAISAAQCSLDSILASCDMNEMKTPNHFYGSRMAAFMGVERGLVPDPKYL